MRHLYVGFGAGSFALAAPIYIMEISEPAIRGALATIMQFMVTSGNIFVNAVGSVIPWPVLTGICIVFPGKKNAISLETVNIFFNLHFSDDGHVDDVHA